MPSQHRKEFWIDRVVQDKERVFVDGRALVGPIFVEDQFTCAHRFPTSVSEIQSDERENCRTIQLKVTTIFIKVVGFVEEISPPYSGRLEISGEGWQTLAYNDVVASA